MSFSNSDSFPFFGSQFFLSNMHTAPIFYNNELFPTSEHFYMHSRATHFYSTHNIDADFTIANQILSVTSPFDAKTLGKQVLFSHARRKEWSFHKIEIMTKAIYLKFSQNPRLKELLLETYPKTLIEATNRDSFWGSGLPTDDKRHHTQPNRLPGQNALGILLMSIREYFRMHPDEPMTPPNPDPASLDPIVNKITDLIHLYGQIRNEFSPEPISSNSPQQDPPQTTFLLHQMNKCKTPTTKTPHKIPQQHPLQQKTLLLTTMNQQKIQKKLQNS